MANSLNKITTKSILDATVATADIADDAVTLAKMAAGTDGQIITYDASGNPTAVGPGTDGQVLTSTGAGSPPAFESIPASGIASLVADTSPQLGGDLDTNSFEISLDDDHKVKFGAGNDLEIHHSDTGHHSYITHSGAGKLHIASTGDDAYLKSSENVALMVNDTEIGVYVIKNGKVGLYHDNTEQCYTAANGLAFPSGKGIDFHPQGGSSVNLLDDYEEGSWNASISGAEGGGPTSYSGSGSYIKVGRLVHCVLKWSDVTFPGLGGQLEISAPFTAGSDANNARGSNCYFAPNSAWDDYTDMVGMGPRISAGEGTFKLDVFLKDSEPTTQSSGSGGRNGNISAASGIYLDFSITYLTT